MKARRPAGRFAIHGGGGPSGGGGGSTPGAVSHGFVTNWVDTAATAKGQADAAAFLFDGTLPRSLTVVP